MIRETSDHRGDATRRTMLHTAIEMFAAAGFDGVSTRALAARAGVNQPAIQYHFDSKEGLYRAAIEWIADDLIERVQDLTSRIEALLDQPQVDRSAARQLLFEMLDRFVGIILQKEGRESWGNFMARAEIENHPALDHFGKVVSHYLISPCAGLLSVILNKPRGDQKTVLMAMVLFGMVTGFKTHCVSSSVWKTLQWTSIGPAQIATIKSVVHEQTEAILAAAEARDP